MNLVLYVVFTILAFGLLIASFWSTKQRETGGLFFSPIVTVLLFLCTFLVFIVLSTQSFYITEWHCYNQINQTVQSTLSVGSSTITTTNFTNNQICERSVDTYSWLGRGYGWIAALCIFFAIITAVMSIRDIRRVAK